ncbi:MAG: metallophosphoesterase [Alphaproteobacteria bacterium]|nr:metallophosphoesterase [Alphaproteobacteria bacterium]
MTLDHQNNNDDLTVAIVSDVHHGPDRGTKKGSDTLQTFHRFVSFVEKINPDFSVDLGDRISDTNHDTDAQYMKEIAQEFRKVPGDLFHLLGNHDLAKLSPQENKDILFGKVASFSMDRKGFHIVFWNTNPKLDEARGFSSQDEDLEWLKADLAATDLPTVVFTHLPLDNGSMKGNFYFDKDYPHHAGYPEAQGEKIRTVIEESGKVIICINGHAHWNAYHCIDGIHYVTIPSLTETFLTWPNPDEAYARLCIGEQIEIEVFGRAPIFYRLPIRKLGAHWVSSFKEYSPKRILPS